MCLLVGDDNIGSKAATVASQAANTYTNNLSEIEKNKFLQNSFAASRLFFPVSLKIM